MFSFFHCYISKNFYEDYYYPVIFIIGLCNISFLSIAQQTKSTAFDSRFIKHIITNDFISEGVTVADINKDGKPDIIAGAYWFEAPNWIKHEIAEPQHFSPTTGYSNSFLNFSMDVNQDGWIDVIRISFPGEEAVWYENPKNNSDQLEDALYFA